MMAGYCGSSGEIGEWKEGRMLACLLAGSVGRLVSRSVSDNVNEYFEPAQL
jgi:hypothetical protein